MPRPAECSCSQVIAGFMAFILFLLANALLYIRPAELFPAMGNLPLYLACIVGTIV